MCDFSTEDWMSDNSLTQDSEWVGFDGKLLSEFCDLKTFDGTVVGPCWFNGNYFIEVHSDHGGRTFHPSNVSKVRGYITDEIVDGVVTTDDRVLSDDEDDEDDEGEFSCDGDLDFSICDEYDFRDDDNDDDNW